MGDFIFIAQKDEIGKAQTASRKKTAVLTLTKHQLFASICKIHQLCAEARVRLKLNVC